MRKTELLVLLAVALAGVAGAEETLMGCLSEDMEVGAYRVLTKAGERVRISGGLNLKNQVDHEVELTGDYVEPLHIFHATGVKTISDDCDDYDDEDSEREGLTADDQGTGDADVKVTREIRQAINNDDSLSLTAKNVKVITSNGMVTLRGEVPSEREKQAIAGKAAKVAGLGNVDDGLTVKPAKANR